jgi:hypothetical protein
MKKGAMSEGKGPAKKGRRAAEVEREVTNMKKFLRMAPLIGAGLVVVVFAVFGRGLKIGVMGVDMVVSYTIYRLIFVEILVPWIEFRGGVRWLMQVLLVRWVMAGLYSVVAIGMMCLCHAWGAGFWLQLMVQVVLYVLLRYGQKSALFVSSRLMKDLRPEDLDEKSLREVKQVMRKVKRRIDAAENAPSNFPVRAREIAGASWLLLPARGRDSYDLQAVFGDAVGEITIGVSGFQMDEEGEDRYLGRAERQVDHRWFETHEGQNED